MITGVVRKPIFFRQRIVYCVQTFCSIIAECECGDTYLQQEWLQFAIQDDVKAEDLKAGATSHMIREARPVVVFDDWMS